MVIWVVREVEDEPDQIMSVASSIEQAERLVDEYTREGTDLFDCDWNTIFAKYSYRVIED